MYDTIRGRPEHAAVNRMRGSEWTATREDCWLRFPRYLVIPAIPRN
jgi:hypothetical protein